MVAAEAFRAILSVSLIQYVNIPCIHTQIFFYGILIVDAQIQQFGASKVIPFSAVVLNTVMSAIRLFYTFYDNILGQYEFTTERI